MATDVSREVLPSTKHVAPPSATSMPHIPALDGVRALAVTAVLVYHLGLGGLPGGFLGVDVFFVLSGYLITTLLISQRHRDGSVSLGRFYFRRARRLFPALYVVLLATVTYCLFFLPEELARLRGDVVAALTYVTNWFLVAHQESYFEALGRPDLLRHLWSLAVEEQFYLIWPIVLILLLGRSRRVRINTALLWTVAAIAASTLLMAVMYDPFADPSRVYFGTDTHAAALLVGAACAMVWRPWAGTGSPAPSAGRTLDALGISALVVLIAFFVFGANTSPWMYRGGFLVVALASAVLIAVVVHPSSRALPWAFGSAALVWIGMRSYAIYLWHWPVFMVTRPEDVPLDGAALAILRLAVAVALAALSFRFIEDPIRRGAIGRWWSATDQGLQGRRLAGGLAVALTLGLVLLGAGTVALVTAKPVEAANIAVDQGATQELELSPGATQDGGKIAPTESGSPEPTTSGSPAEAIGAPTGPPFKIPITVGLFGDSTGMTLTLNEPAGLSKYLAISDQTVEGCSLIEGRITSQTGFRRDLSSDCGSWESRWSDKAGQLKPDIALVNLGAWDVFDIELDGKRMAFGSPAWDAYFSQQLDLGIKILVRSGAQVAMSEVPCFRPVAAGGLPKLPERGMDDRTRHLNALIEEAAAKWPGRAFLVKPPAEFCKDPTISKSLAYRWDGTHYYKPGAKLYFDVVTPQLLKVPSRG